MRDGEELVTFIDPWLVLPRYCEHGKIIDDDCDDCYQAETGHYPTCQVYEGTQRGPCDCSVRAGNRQ